MSLESPEIQKEKFEYEHFDNEKQRDDILFFTKNAVEYIEKIGECNLVFMDRAARPAYAAIDEYWNIKHGDDDLLKPKFYFVSPKGFLTNKDWAAGRNSNMVLEAIKEKLPELVKDKDKPLVLIDACVHLGTTFENVGYHFEQLGFKVTCLVANITNNYSDLKFEGSSVKSDKCDIFGDTSCYGDIISKNYDSIISTKTIKENEFEQLMTQDEAKTVRKEIRQIIKDGLGVLD